MPSPEKTRQIVQNELGRTQFPLAPFPRIASYTAFDRLPAAAVAAGTDPNIITLGTNTEVVARDDKGGVLLTTEAAASDGDNALLIPDSGSVFGALKLSAENLFRFETRINLAAITTAFWSFGLDENITDADPAGTAGDGAAFLFDPTDDTSSGIASGDLGKFIMAWKVNGADTFEATDIVVAADTDYRLAIEFDSTLRPHMYIDGRLKGVGPALTSGDTVQAKSGVEITSTTARSFATRYMALSRLAG